MYTKIISEKTNITLDDGTVLVGGFMIYNSEVGRGSVNGDIFIHNKVNSSGIICRGWEGVRQVHRRKNLEDALQKISGGIRDLAQNMNGAIKQASDLQRIICTEPDALIEKISEGTTPTLTVKQKSAIEGSRHGMVVKTMWDVLQVFAKASTSNLLCIEDKTTLMRIAGNIAHEAKTKLRVYTV